MAHADGDCREVSAMLAACIGGRKRKNCVSFMESRGPFTLFFGSVGNCLSSSRAVLSRGTWPPWPSWSAWKHLLIKWYTIRVCSATCNLQQITHRVLPVQNSA